MAALVTPHELRRESGGDFYRALVMLSPTAVLVLEEDGRIWLANRQAQRLLGGDLEGRGFDALFKDHDGGRAAAYVAGLARTDNGRAMFFTGEMPARDGQRDRFVHVHGTNLRVGTRFTGLLLSVVDGTEARQREADLRHAAHHDSLTGLPNRTLMVERVRQVASLTPGAATLLFVDLDGFKLVNDRLGHQTGDQLLIEVARRLDRVVPAEATVSRLGGDEFAVLLPDTPTPVAAKVAEKVLEELRAPGPIAAGPISASIGIAEIESTDEAFRRADIAMYAAKVAGRSRAVVYEPEVEQALRTHAPDSSVEALRAERDRLHTEARTDALTRLPNRRALDEYLTSFDGPRPVSVLFVDLDHFGAYNHRHGDVAGDTALWRVGQLLRDGLRDVDRVFRKGGEEFCIVLPGAGETDAWTAGERLRATVEGAAIEHAGLDAGPVLTVTVGVATCDDADLATGLGDAGAVAYRCKNEGRRNSVAAAPTR